MKRLIPLLALTLYLVWYFYLARHPAGIESLEWLGTVAALIIKRVVYPYLVAIFIFAAGFSVGLRVFPQLDGVHLVPVILSSVAVGMGILGLGIFVIGMLQIMYWPVVIGWCVICLVSGFGDLKLIVRQFTLPNPCISREIFFLIGLLLILILINAHTPLFPVTTWDACNSHLEAPKVFIRDHGINFYPYINFNNFPLLTEMWSVPCLILGSPEAAQCITFIWFILLIVAMGWFSYMYLGSTVVGLLGGIILFTNPAFMQHTHTVTTDVALVFYLFMAATWIAPPPKIGSRWYWRYRWIHLAIPLGIAFCIKYTAIPVMLIYLLWLLLRRVPLRYILCVVLIALLIAFPFYIRSVILFGNPVFPFVDDAFRWAPGLVDSDTRARLAVNPGDMLWKYRYPGGPERAVTWLWTASVDPAWSGRMRPIGPLYLFLLPLALVMLLSSCGTTGIALRMMLFTSLGIVFYWLFIVGIIHTRYLFPAYPLMSLLAGWTLSKMNSKALKGLVLLAIIAVLAVTYSQEMMRDRREWRDLPLTEDARGNFRANVIAPYPGVMWLNEILGPDDVVYGLFCENGRYYADFTLVGGIYGYGTHLEIAKYRTGQEFYDYLKGFGADYLIVNKLRFQYAVRQVPEMAIPHDGLGKLYWIVYELPHLIVFKLKEEE